MADENNVTKKRFDSWEVDCNECSRYWDDSCDGVKKGSTRQCMSYVATRELVIPEKISHLENQITTLSWWVGFLSFFYLLHLVIDIFGY